jgi:hypothetical protein
LSNLSAIVVSVQGCGVDSILSGGLVLGGPPVLTELLLGILYWVGGRRLGLFALVNTAIAQLGRDFRVLKSLRLCCGRFLLCSGFAR